MKKLRLFLSLLAITASAAAWAAEGDTFTAQTTEGVTLTFKVTSESPKTCQVGNGIDQVNQVYGETLDKVTIPATANGYSVTAIGRYAFRYWSKTTQFVIPNTVKTLDLGAFMECTGISSIDLNQVETIGDYAFGKCTGITLMILPASVKSIGKAAFQDCYSLKQVTTDGSSPSLQSIGQEAFVGCRQLEGVWFNGSPLAKIGQQAFYNCQALTVASFENCPLVYIMSQAFSGCTALKTTNIFNNIFTIQSIEEKLSKAAPRSRRSSCPQQSPIWAAVLSKAVLPSQKPTSQSVTTSPICRASCSWAAPICQRSNCPQPRV